MFIIYLIKTLLGGISRILQETFHFAREQWRRILFWEKLFIISLLCIFYLLSQGWRKYQVVFNDSFSVTHVIHTDDFLWLFIFYFLSFLPIIFYFSEQQIRTKLKTILGFLRMFSLVMIVMIYFINLFWPERITVVKESVFTWQFFVFGFSLVFNIITGYWGIIAYAQYPVKN